MPSHPGNGGRLSAVGSARRDGWPARSPGAREPVGSRDRSPPGARRPRRPARGDRSLPAVARLFRGGDRPEPRLRQRSSASAPSSTRTTPRSASRRSPSTSSWARGSPRRSCRSSAGSSRATAPAPRPRSSNARPSKRRWTRRPGPGVRPVGPDRRRRGDRRRARPAVPRRAVGRRHRLEQLRPADPRPLCRARPDQLRGPAPVRRVDGPRRGPRRPPAIPRLRHRPDRLHVGDRPRRGPARAEARDRRRGLGRRRRRRRAPRRPVRGSDPDGLPDPAALGLPDRGVPGVLPPDAAADAAATRSTRSSCRI